MKPRSDADKAKYFVFEDGTCLPEGALVLSKATPRSKHYIIDNKGNEIKVISSDFYRRRQRQQYVFEDGTIVPVDSILINKGSNLKPNYYCIDKNGIEQKVITINAYKRRHQGKYFYENGMQVPKDIPVLSIETSYHPINYIIDKDGNEQKVISERTNQRRKEQTNITTHSKLNKKMSLVYEDNGKPIPVDAQLINTSTSSVPKYFHVDENGNYRRVMTNNARNLQKSRKKRNITNNYTLQNYQQVMMFPEKKRKIESLEISIQETTIQEPIIQLNEFPSQEVVSLPKTDDFISLLNIADNNEENTLFYDLLSTQLFFGNDNKFISENDFDIESTFENNQFKST